MEQLRKFLFILLLSHRLAGGGFLYAQNPGETTIDSLLPLLHKANEDSNKVNLLNRLSYSYYSVKPDIGIEYGQQALKLAAALNWKRGISKAYNNLAINYFIKSEDSLVFDYNSKALKVAEEAGDKQCIAHAMDIFGAYYKKKGDYPKALADYFSAIKIEQEIGDRWVAIATGQIGIIYSIEGNAPKALEYYFKSMQIGEEIGDKHQIVAMIGDVGLVYKSQYSYSLALEYYFKALKIAESLPDKNGMAHAEESIGELYVLLNDYSKALEYSLKALAVYDEIQDKLSIAIELNAVGEVYSDANNYPKAMEYFLKALKTDKEVGNKNSPALGNIGNIYLKEHNYSLAMEYYHKALKASEAVNDKEGIALFLGSIGETHLLVANDTTRQVRADSLIPLDKRLNLRKAVDFLNRSVNLSGEIGSLSSLQHYSNVLSKAQQRSGNYKEALESYIQYTRIRDSVFSNESKIKIANSEAKRETDLKEKQIEVQRLQIVAAKNERNYYIAGLGMLVLGTAGLFARFRSVRRNKRQLEGKNLIIAAEKENADTLRVRAERSEQFKQQFLANMSHEIRTPMNAVNGMTDLLLEKKPRPDQLHYLQVISKSSDILLHIINDILDLSKIEVGKLELEAIDFSLADTLSQVRETLSFRAEEKGLHFIVNIGRKVPDVLVGDPYRLNQILINLGGNAIKFTERGSVEISVVSIAHASQGDRDTSLLFSVIDTGKGIPADKVLSLFENFKQLNASDTRKYGGTGLGLSISKQLVELQGGNISVESEEGSGTVFSFTLTYPKGNREKLNARALAEQKADGSVLTGLRILLADDNEYNRLVVTETLHSKTEVVIDEAINGAEAIKLLEQNDYDVVLMDVQMPEMNGFEATAYIRDKLPHSKNQIPVIALTASLLRSDIDLCYKAGMNTYVPKPFKAWQLIAAIAEQTGRKNTGIKEQKKENTKIIEMETTVGITDLTYLTKFSDGDAERMKKFIRLFVTAVPVFSQSIKVAIIANDQEEMAALMHTFKPKWMMMGMKQTTELGQKIEALCKEYGNKKEILTLLAQLLEQNEIALKELENRGEHIT